MKRRLHMNTVYCYRQRILRQFFFFISLSTLGREHSHPSTLLYQQLSMTNKDTVVLCDSILKYNARTYSCSDDSDMTGQSQVILCQAEYSTSTNCMFWDNKAMHLAFSSPTVCVSCCNVRWASIAVQTFRDRCGTLRSITNLNDSFKQ